MQSQRLGRLFRLLCSDRGVAEGGKWALCCLIRAKTKGREQEKTGILLGGENAHSNTSVSPSCTEETVSRKLDSGLDSSALLSAGEKWE